ESTAEKKNPPHDLLSPPAPSPPSSSPPHVDSGGRGEARGKTRWSGRGAGAGRRPALMCRVLSSPARSTCCSPRGFVHPTIGASGSGALVAGSSLPMSEHCVLGYIAGMELWAPGAAARIRGRAAAFRCLHKTHGQRARQKSDQALQCPKAIMVELGYSFLSSFTCWRAIQINASVLFFSCSFSKVT
ncbi:unnamed protein product, partial [Urochloa humidicola]